MPDRLAQALDRSLAVVAALSDGELPFGILRERSGGLPAPTFARLLKALVASGVLMGSRNGYRLGPRFLGVARGALGGLSEGEHLRPVLDELARASGESAAFYARREGRCVLVAVHEMPDSPRYMPLGGTVPEATRHGFAMAAVMRADAAAQKAAWQACPFRKETAWTTFRDALAEARRAGAVVELGRHKPGILRVAAPVGRRGSIGVSSARCEAAHAKTLVPLVVAAAAAAERILGERP